MIRILHSVSNMDRGGIETMLMNYYRNIDRTQVQFDFLCNKAKPGAYDEEICSLGGRIFHSPGLNPLKYPEYVSFMKQLVKEHPEYRVIEVHNEALGLYALHSAKKAGIKTRIYHAHAQGINLDVKFPLKWVCKKFLKYNFTHHFTCGLAAGRFYYGDEIMDKGDFTFVHNAIDVARFVYNGDTRAAMRAKYGLEDRHVVGHIGRFMQQKNHEFLIRVFAEIKKTDAKAYLVLLGDGELMAKVKRQVASFGLADDVLFVGNVPNANEWYQAFDLFILPSHWEGLPVVGVETQAADVPSLFSDSITPEIELTDRAHFLSLEQPVSEWADLSVRLLKEGNTRCNRSHEISSKGYDIKNESKKLQELYINLYSNS
ncbi:MAG: glycosyltransferase family 1 protein [Paludibacteraceae bacterium]|nr:glycosyltransferase family 1 protein [Paludibacteraceae bacterium]